MAATPATQPRVVNSTRPVESRRARYEKRLAALKRERGSYETHWQEIADVLLPRRVRFQPTNTTNKGQKVNQNIVDSTATLAHRTLKSGMMAGLTSPARPWFRLTTADPALAEQADVKQWLYSTEVRMREVFSRSNLYSCLPVFYGDLGGFATAAMELLEDEEDVIRLYPYPVGSYFLANSARLAVDTCIRELVMTVRQVVEEFVKQPSGAMDWSRCSSMVKEAWDQNNLDRWVEIVRVVEPNPDYVSGRADRTGMRWRSCYYERGAPEAGKEDVLLRESGFHEFPILASRWDVTGEDVYGYGPGMDALGDIKQLQLEQRRKMQAIDKMVSPPMRGPESLRNRPRSLLPGDTTFVDATAGTGTFEPAYVPKPDLQHLLLDMQETKQTIRRAFYEDLFLMLTMNDRREITAREIEERHEEKLLMLGPVLERLNGELLNPLIDRTFAIMYRRGMIDEPPESIAGSDLKVEYISMLAQAQKAVGTGGIERLTQYALTVAQVDPGIMDKFDANQSLDELGQMLGTPPKLVRSDDDAAALRRQRDAQVRAQQMAAMAPDVAKAAKDASETEMGGDTALSRLAQGAGAAA